jgi:hypothetical protein
MGLVLFGAMALYLLIAILGGARADLVDGGRWLPKSRRWRHADTNAAPINICIWKATA